MYSILSICMQNDIKMHTWRNYGVITGPRLSTVYLDALDLHLSDKAPTPADLVQKDREGRKLKVDFATPKAPDGPKLSKWKSLYVRAGLFVIN